jgi:hypothetical protein
MLVLVEGSCDVAWHGQIHCALLVVQVKEGSCDVAWYGQIHSVLLVVPVKGDSTVEFAIPVTCGFVVFFESIVQAIGMLLAKIFYPKVVDNQQE